MNIHASSLEGALSKFGLTEFRPGQKDVIEAIVAGHDCLCVMPTGGGKSLCFQLPSIIRPGLTIVVSPLIALMKDQVDRLGQLGISAALINSTLSASEQQSRLQAVTAGKYQLIYVAPERLRNSRFLEAIRATPTQLLAIDEAHCISQWGHDFRPDYARIGKFREWLGGVQTVALTATATPRVRDDIVEVLGLQRPKQFMSGFARPNLHFGVVQRQNDRDKDEELESFLRRTPGAGIIYSATRKRCDALVEWISQKLRIPVGAYHAGLQLDQRRAIQERFMKNELRIIVATNAFGMGIDKADLRFVIHYNMPGSLEAYYQEAGRAGRDGKQSQCVMLYSFQDRYIQEFFIDNNYPPREVIEQVYTFLAAREEDPIELTLEEIRDALGLSVSPEAIGSSLQILSRTQVLERLEMGGGLAIVRIDSDLPTLVDLLPREARVRRTVLRVLERAVGDRRGEQVQIHPRWLLQESGVARETLVRALREISKLDGIDYIPPFRGRAVHFAKTGVPFADLQIDFASLEKRKQAEYDRLNQVVGFAQSPLCRQSTILKYFGDTSAENCGHCDRCHGRPGWPEVPAEVQATPSGREPAPASQPRAPNPSSDAQTQFLEQVLEAIERIHGRLGKHLIAQYLCGSQNAKVQKLNLHRLGSFGLLKRFRQSDALALLDVLLAAGILQQTEVNRNRPTVSLAPQLVDVDHRRELIRAIRLTPRLESLIASAAPRVGSDGPTVSEPLPPPESSPAGSEHPRLLETRQVTATEPPPSSKVPTPSPAVPTPPPHVATRQSAAGQSVANTSSVSQDDFRWTLKLFGDGYRWSEVQKARRMSDDELAASLVAALQAGQSLQRNWLAPEADQLRSGGQQRLLRELQRRSAAGIR